MALEVRAHRGLVPEYALEPLGAGDREVRGPRGLRGPDGLRVDRRMLLRRPAGGRGGLGPRTPAGRGGDPPGDPPRVPDARGGVERAGARARSAPKARQSVRVPERGDRIPRNVPRHPDGPLGSHLRGAPARPLPARTRRLRGVCVTAEYPERPVPAAAGVVVRGNDILLVKRGWPPHQGRWSIPG